MLALRLFLLFALLSCLSDARAHQGSNAVDVVPWHVRVEPAQVPPGGVARLVYQARLDTSEAGLWKMYALGSPRPSRAVRIVLTDLPQGVVQSAPHAQWGEQRGYDRWFDTTVVYFERQALLWTELQVGAEVADGAHQVRGAVHFMVCNERICLPPATWPFALELQVSRDARVLLPATPPVYDATLMRQVPAPLER